MFVPSVEAVSLSFSKHVFLHDRYVDSEYGF